LIAMLGNYKHVGFFLNVILAPGEIIWGFQVKLLVFIETTHISQCEEFCFEVNMRIKLDRVNLILSV